MSKDYGKIKTTAELDRAINDIHARRKQAGKGLDRKVKALRKRMKPANLVVSAASRYLPYLGWSEVSLGLIRGLKKRLKK